MIIKEKKCLMVHDYMTDKLLGKITRLSIEKIECIRIWINTNDKLS